MAKCPLYKGNCEFESSLRGGEGMDYRRYICEGRDPTTSDKWQECAMYDSDKASSINPTWRSNGALVWLARLPIIVIPIVMYLLLAEEHMLMLFVAIFAIWISCKIIRKE